METPLFFQGLVLGLAIAAPVGPIGVLCIRRTLAEGRVAGFVSGLGAATADAMYGSVAALGLTVISAFLIQQQTPLRIVGGLFLCYLGVQTLRARPAEQMVNAAGGNLLSDYVSTLFLTLTNPMTILAFAAIFAGVGLASVGGGIESAIALVAGVFCGSALWWLTLSTGVSLLRTRVTAGVLRWVNIMSGVIIVGFGLTALVSLLPLP
ncbi:MAG: LysE family transporter [Caldilineales bacterium]|nr:LysE family transporter [Caldilineales bacterium]